MMKKQIWLAVSAAFILAICFTLWQTLREKYEGEATISIADAMGGNSTEGYLRASGPRKFQFPEDHGPHPGFRTEWWYYTGNLFADDGRQFGYQFTIFRNQLTPSTMKNQGVGTTSSWSSNQIYLAHFAISDVENMRHIFDERYSRGAAGLACAQVQPYKIWLEDWTIENLEENNTEFPNALSVHIKAEMEGGASINLKTRPLKPAVFQGDHGYDEKGSDEGNASYYISFTRLATEGSITIDNQNFTVRGQSWMDHEWSTSALGDNQKGWDWFSIQLSNGYDLMYYQLRNQDGSLSAFSTITLVDKEGKKIPIDVNKVDLKVLERWESPHSGESYPSEWLFSIPEVDIEFKVATLIPDQEMNVSVRYYEGAVTVQGKMAENEISGQGFIEMTGYEVE